MVFWRRFGAMGAGPAAVASSLMSFPVLVWFCWGCTWQESSKWLLKTPTEGGTVNSLLR